MKRFLLKRIKNLTLQLSLSLGFLLLLTSQALSQDIAITAASGGLAASPLNAGASNISVFGVTLTKAGGGGRTVTGLTFGMTSDPNGKFTNPRLYESPDATFSGVGTETLIAGGVLGTLNSGDISFSGGTITDFDGASGGDVEHFFLVVDVAPGVTGATATIQPSLATSGVTTAATVTGVTLTGTDYSFALAQVTLAAGGAAGLAGSPLTAGATLRAVLGFSLQSNGSQSVTALNVQVTSTAVSKWGSYTLYKSTNATFDSGSDTDITGESYDASSGTEIAITGLNETITTTQVWYFLVVTVDPSVTGATTAITPSLGSANITTNGTATGSTVTGTAYSFTAPQLTIAAGGATGLAASPLVAGATNQAVLGFSLTSDGSQTVTAMNVQVTSTAVSKWGSYTLVRSTDNDFSTGGNNTDITGESYDASSGTQIAIAGLNETVSSQVWYFLVVTIDPSVNAGTGAVTPSLAGANVTLSPGTATGTVTGTAYSFAPLLTIGGGTTTASSPLVAGATNQAVFGFSLQSSGSQTVSVVNVQVTSTPVSKWGSYKLYRSTDATFSSGSDTDISGGLTFTPSASQVAITGLSESITTTISYYFLVVTVDPAVTGATGALTPSLATANVTVNTGGKTGSATGTNYSFTAASATFTEITAGTAPVMAGTVLSAGTTLQVLTGFSVTSTGGQTLSAISFNYTGLGSQFTDEYLYKSTTPGVIGSEIVADNTPDGSFTGLTESIGATTTYYYLLVDVDPAVYLATANVTTAPTQANVTITGNKNSFSISRTFSFISSMLSTVVLNTGTTDDILYSGFRSATMTDNGSNSVSIAQLNILDGGGATDPDNQETILTGITVSLTNHAYLRKIALYDGGTEIAGTEKTVSSSIVGNEITWDLSSTPLVANDGSNNNFTIRVTFQNTVVDNQFIHVTVTDVNFDDWYSGFAAADGGGATTSGVADPANKIEVVATTLAFLANPPSTGINTNFSLSLRARDGQNNVDLDDVSQVELTATGGGGTLSLMGGSSQSLTPFLTAGAYDWTDLRINQSGTYTLAASDDNYDNNYGDASGSVTITSSPSSITPGTLTGAPICYGTGFATLSNIVITETDPAGISGSPGSYTFSIALPAGFVFDPTVTTGVGVSGGADILTPSGYTYQSSNTIVQFSFTLTGTANTNTITISGLKVGATHPGTVSPGATGTLDITRSGGTATIAGVSASTDLGDVSASQQGAGTASFTVAALSGNIDPNTTSFNNNSPAVKLVPSPSTGTILFTGSGITFVNPDYRFNPSSLSPNTYPITFTHTDASGCQTIAQKTFTVYTSGIGNLDPAYCNNDGPSLPFNVNQTFIDNTMGPGWSLDHYTYYDPYLYHFNLSVAANATVGDTYINNGQVFTVVRTIAASNILLCSGTGNPIGPGTLSKSTGTGDLSISFSNYYQGDFRPITSPANNQFDPSLPAYQTIVQYFGGQIPIGFAVCNGGSVPCNGTSNTGTFNTYQWVTINTAPSPSFTIAQTAFCLDDPAVDLIGTPPNSDVITDDFFTENGPGASVTSSGVPKVWSFNPASVTGVTVGSPANFNITYTYKNPSTGCSGTSAPIAIKVSARPSSVTGGTITPGVTQQICQLESPVDFVANTVVGTTYKWYDDNLLTSNLKTGDTFTPPLNNSIAQSNDYYVTRTIDGCESNKEPVSPTAALALSVVVNAIPVAPTPNFSDNVRQYCVGDVVNDTHLEVPGTTVRWYDEFGVEITPSPGNQPTAAQLGITTSAAKVYTFFVTQTANNCQSQQTKMTVTIKALPIVSITSDSNKDKICTTGSDVTFAAFDQGDLNSPALNGDWTSNNATVSSSLNPFPSQGEAVLDPSGVDPGTYTLTYEYTNAGGCTDDNTISITILPKVTPNISIGAVCDKSPAYIVNNSTISAGTSTIAFAEWTFGDGSVLPAGPYASIIDPTIHSGNTNGTYEDPNHIYPNTGTFQISGTLITSDGCKYPFPVSPTTYPVTVSPLPSGNFTWKGVCLDTVTNESTTEFLAVETSDPPLPISSYTWNFAKNSSLTYASAGSGVNPTVNYDVEGTDLVEVTLTTPANCEVTITKPVYIVPSYPAITATNSYTQSFDSGADGWIAGGKNSSWAWGTPAGPVVNGDPVGGTGGGSGGAWDTNLTGNNNPDESSWVLSQCFDFSQSVKPVISLDIWSDNPSGLDGAVLQYNLTGNIEDAVVGAPDSDGDWVVLGTIGQGINWYEESGIANSPGNQTSGDIGWTGKYNDWKRAIFKLDALIGQSDVVFRIAFASVQARGEGFTFDNVFIGERSRVVLMESFTNVSSAINTKTFNEFYNNFGTAAELVKIQYHAPFPGNDALNALNPKIHNARTAFYGITNAPTLRIDGDVAPTVGKSVLEIFDERVLTPSALKIIVTPTKDLGSQFVRINTTIINNSSQELNTMGAHVFTTIVENTVGAPYLGPNGDTQFKFVAKDILPTATGLTINQNLLPGESLDLPEIIWQDRNLITGGNGGIVVHVQKIEGGNKNVFQAVYFDASAIEPDLITETEDPEYVNKIHLYPNPAQQEVNITLPYEVTKTTPVMMLDAYGKEVYQNYFSPGQKRKVINTTDMAAGMYIIRITTPDGGVASKKIMVVH